MSTKTADLFAKKFKDDTIGRGEKVSNGITRGADSDSKVWGPERNHHDVIREAREMYENLPPACEKKAPTPADTQFTSRIMEGIAGLP